jgi:hypothetical protein
VEREGDIEISSLARMREEQAAALRFLVGVGGLGERGEVCRDSSCFPPVRKPPV